MKLAHPLTKQSMPLKIFYEGRNTNLGIDSLHHVGTYRYSTAPAVEAFEELIGYNKLYMKSLIIDETVYNLGIVAPYVSQLSSLAYTFQVGDKMYDIDQFKAFLRKEFPHAIG